MYQDVFIPHPHHVNRCSRVSSCSNRMLFSPSIWWEMTHLANPLFLQSSEGISGGLAWALILESQESMQANSISPKTVSCSQATPGPKVIFLQMTTTAPISSHTCTHTDSHDPSSTGTAQGRRCSPAASQHPIQPQQLLPGQRWEEYNGGMEDKQLPEHSGVG